MDAIVEAVRPTDGTQDAEAARLSIRDALTDLLVRFPDADLLNLTEEERAFAIERFVARDVCHRVDLDIGKAIREQNATAKVVLGRLKQIRDYVIETVAASFRQLRDDGQALTAATVGRIIQAALLETLRVFEGFA